MKIKLKNIGLVKEGEYDIDNLNIFCGDNNTGKTWAIYVFYGLLKFIQQPLFRLKNFDINSLVKELNIKNNLDELFIKGITELPLTKTMFNSVLKLYITDYSTPEHISRDLAVHEDNCKNSSIDLIVSQFHATTKQKIEGQLGKSIILKAQTDSKRQSLHFALTKTTSNEKLTNDADEFNDLNDKIKKMLSEIIVDIIKMVLFNDNICAGKVFINSVERTGSTMFRDDISDAKQMQRMKTILTDKNDQKSQSVRHHVFQELEAIQKFYEDYSNKYPLAVMDNMQTISDVIKISKQVSGIAKNKKPDLKKRYSEIMALFDEIAGGKYSINDGIVYYETNNQSNEHNSSKTIKNNVNRNNYLPITVCASAVRALAHLNLYLRHQMNIGDILIIDEPELNLHPSRQIKMARLLAMISNLGIKVIISTHSDFIIQEFNTLIGLKYLENATVIENTDDDELTSKLLQDKPEISQKKKDKIDAMMKQEGYVNSMLLAPSNIRCAIIKSEPNKSMQSTITPLLIKPISGIISNNFDDTIEKINHIKNIMFFEV